MTYVCLTAEALSWTCLTISFWLTKWPEDNLNTLSSPDVSPRFVDVVAFVRSTQFIL